MDLGWSASYRDWIGPGPTNQFWQFCYEGAYNLLGHTLLKRLYADSPRPRNAGMVLNTRQLLTALRAITDHPAHGQFVVGHLPLPHYPFVHDHSGARPVNVFYSPGAGRGARAQLSHADRVLGDLFDRLRRVGKYDRSTIVLTSDHTWRFDPELSSNTGSQWSHVPLMIKYPGQKTRRDIHRPFSTSRLIRFLSAAPASGDIPVALRAGGYYIPVGGEEARVDFHLPRSFR